MTYSLGLLRAAHRSATVHVTVRQGADTYSGVIVGIGSKLGIRATDGELIEDVPVDRVIWADVQPHSATTGEAYADALRRIEGACVDGPVPDAMGAVEGGFGLLATFSNGYAVHIARNGMTYGGETIALQCEGELSEGSTDGTWGDMPPHTGISAWNDTPLDGPQHALEIARRVAALPARS